MLKTLRKESSDPQWKADGGRYIPYPGTWLATRRWDDELPWNDPAARTEPGKEDEEAMRFWIDMPDGEADYSSSNAPV